MPGDLISFEGYERKPLEVLPAKKNPFDNIVSKLITDGDQIGCFKDETKNVPFTTPKGVCKAPSVKHGIIK